MIGIPVKEPGEGEGAGAGMGAGAEMGVGAGAGEGEGAVMGSCGETSVGALTLEPLDEFTEPVIGVLLNEVQAAMNIDERHKMIRLTKRRLDLLEVLTTIY